MQLKHVSETGNWRMQEERSHLCGLRWEETRVVRLQCKAQYEQPINGVDSSAASRLIATTRDPAQRTTSSCQGQPNDR